jgi:acetyl esterase/lipase
MSMRGLLICAVASGLALTACASSVTTSTPSPSAQLSACPKGQSAPAGGRPGGGQIPSGGQAPGGGALAGLPVATSVAPSDTSTSKVIDPTGSQIQCGQAAVTTHNDVTYSSMGMKLDLIAPTTDGKKPLIVYLPGGGFMTAGRTAALDQRTYIAEQGYVVASVQYRTINDGAVYSDAVADVKSAIRYLRAHADEYGIDTGMAAVWGESAGGYLAAMVGVTNGVQKFESIENLGQSSDVQAVIDKFGPSDLSAIGADFDATAKAGNTAAGNGAAQWVFGRGTTKSVLDDPATVAQADPVTYIDAGDPAFLLFHGSADTLVSPSQTLLVHNALRAKGVDSTRYVVKGAGHGDLAVISGDANAALPWTTQEVVGDMVTFLNGKLKG